MTIDINIAAQLETWRQKAVAGKLDDDELRAWIIHCRQGRVAASQVSAKSRSKKAAPDVDSMIADLEGIE